MSSLLLLAGTAWARMRGGVWYDRRRPCPGCQRPVRVMRRGPGGVEGCTSCIPPVQAGVPNDHF